ncbi:MAG: endonuclease V [Candidatus Asgardarchaeia archaeon]
MRIGSKALEKLKEFQGNICKRAIFEDSFERIEYVAGVDIAYRGELALGVAVLLDLDGLEVLEFKKSLKRIVFPYIPTYLAFREAIPIMDALNSLSRRPDLVVFDSHGLAHPRFCGCATHVGVLMDIPSIGVAKKLLVGRHEPLPEEEGSYSPIVYMGRVVGFAFRSKKGCRPIYVSPGHRVSLETSLELVKSMVKGYRIPEPTRMAHKLCVSILRGIKSIDSQKSS